MHAKIATITRKDDDEAILLIIFAFKRQEQTNAKNNV